MSENLTPENRALVERDTNRLELSYLFSGGHGRMLERLLDAAREEGRALAKADAILALPPQVGGGNMASVAGLPRAQEHAPTPSNLDLVRAFHTAFDIPILPAPAFPDPARIDMRLRILDEERAELSEAIEARDLVEVADALTDMAYLVYGTALEFGIDLNPCFREVHRSNMSKLGHDGKPIHRLDGKVLKGPNYSRPNLAPLLQLDAGVRSPSAASAGNLPPDAPLPSTERETSGPGGHLATVSISEREDGGLVVVGEDLPGLILSGGEPAQVMATVLPAVLALLSASPLPPAPTRGGLAYSTDSTDAPACGAATSAHSQSEGGEA